MSISFQLKSNFISSNENKSVSYFIIKCQLSCVCMLTESPFSLPFTVMFLFFFCHSFHCARGSKMPRNAIEHCCYTVDFLKIARK